MSNNAKSCYIRITVCNFFAHNLDLFFIDVNDRNDNKRT